MGVRWVSDTHLTPSRHSRRTSFRVLERVRVHRSFSWSRTVALLALYAVTSVLTRLVVSGNDIVNVDESSYMVGGWELLRGHLPYAGFADNKPPLIYVYYALTQFLGHGMWSVRLVTALVTVPLTALAASAFYRHDRRGIVAAFAFLLFSASYDAGEMLAVNCELVMMLPLAWALVLVRDDRDVSRRRLLGVGVLIGVASLVKYQAVLWVPAVVAAVAVAASRTRWKNALAALAAIAGGLLIPVAATVSLFALAGGIEGFFYWNVTHNIGYVLSPTTTGDAIERGAGQLVPFFGVTSILWFGLARSFEQQSRYWKVLTAGLIVMSLAAASIGLRFFPHYFVQLYIPLAIGAAPWMASLLTWPLTTPAWIVAASSLSVFAVFTASNTMRFVASRPRLNDTSLRVAARLRGDSCYQNGSMFVWGSAPIFYYHSELPLASRFFFPEFPLVPLYAGNRRSTEHHARPIIRDRRGRHWRWLMADLRQSEPTYILDTAPAHLKMWEYFPLHDYPQLERFVRRRYEPMASIDGVQIYRRRDCDMAVVARATQ
jgi:dolichyl-phosphate-mannose-protein mannosyltransferase